MVRTQIQLTPEQAKALDEIAANQHVSKAEFIRRALDKAIEANQGESKRVKRERALRVMGIFRSGIKDLARNHDKYLAEAFKS